MDGNEVFDLPISAHTQGGSECFNGDRHLKRAEMGDNQVFNLPVVAQPRGGSEYLDDDDHLKRTGTVWTASAHIMTTVIGSGVVSLAWAIAQMGWLIGPTVMLFFSFVTYYTSALLTACYRSGDPVPGKRNHTYLDAVGSILGGNKFKICGLAYHMNLFGAVIGYIITSSISMNAIRRSICFRKSPCHKNRNPDLEMIVFGIIQIIIIIFSQTRDFNQLLLLLLSVVATVMSFTYSAIGIGLGVAKVAETGKFRGNLTGISIGTVTETQKIWRSFQALGVIAFAFSYSNVLIEIQDTIKSPPSEAKTMKKASLIRIGIITPLYMLFGCFGYAAFGDLSPENLFTGFGFYNPYWLVDIANAAIFIHLVYAYQAYCQPLFVFVEKKAAERFPDSEFITKEIKVPIPGFRRCKLNLFRFVWRAMFVFLTTVISMLLPFFNDVVGLLGALGFWPLTVYFPVEMYIVQNEIANWSRKWLCFQILSFACLIVTIVAAAGSIAEVAADLKSYKPFKTIY